MQAAAAADDDRVPDNTPTSVVAARLTCAAELRSVFLRHFKTDVRQVRHCMNIFRRAYPEPDAIVSAMRGLCTCCGLQLGDAGNLVAALNELGLLDP